MGAGEDGSTGERTPAEEWLAGLGDSVRAVDRFGAGALVIDGTTERILGHNPTAAALIGGPVPATVQGLVDGGRVARPDIALIRRRLVAWRAVEDELTRDRGSSHSWSGTLHIHTPDGSPRLVQVTIAHLLRPLLGAEAVFVTLWSDDIEPAPANDVGVTVPVLNLVYDEEMRIVAVDPRLADLGIDPETQIGTLGTVLTHPEDLPQIVPAIGDVLTRRTVRSEVSLRVVGPGGRWIPARLELTRLLTSDRPLIAGRLRLLAESRRHIGQAAGLTARELDVVAALFDGIRIPQLAARDGRSVSTVRNQLSSAFAKLGVTSQADLLATYHHPRPN